MYRRSRLHSPLGLSLSVKQTDDPLKDDPVAAIDNTCVGCGNCGEVSEAAVLCPSFYRADVIMNPTAWDRFTANIRQKVIGWLQRRRESRRVVFAAEGA
jgi:indolepyruvate ferredoxin oxidoreductase, alpha subunit